MEMGRWRQSEEAYERALKLNPTHVEALMNLATLYGASGRRLEALAGYELALWHQPDHVSGHIDRAFALLNSGDYPAGFAEFEWRWRRPRTPMRYTQPMWDGSDLKGKTLLLWREEGLGDTINFIRYAAIAKARERSA